MTDAAFIVVLAILSAVVEAGFVALIAWGISAVFGLAFWPVFAVAYLAFIFVRLATNN